MRYNLLIVLSLLLLSTASVAGGKFAYVDMRRAISETDDGKAVKSMLQAEVASKQLLLNNLQSEIKALKDSLDKQGSIMKPSVRKQKEEQMKQKIEEAQRQYIGMQQGLAQKEQEAMGGVLKKFETVLQKIGNEGDYAMIFTKSEGALLYAKSHLDLTNEVIRKYNQMFSPKTKKGKK